MKEWNKPVVEEMNISETQYGGDPTRPEDNTYYDENNAANTTFES